MDLATVSSFVDESISVLYNNGSASFVTRVDYPLGTSGLFLEGGDLNGDGFADLVASGNFGQSEDVLVLLNDGAGGFAAAVNYEVPGLNNNLKRGFALGDLDEDGDLDVIYAGGSEVGFQSPVMIMFNNGDGTLAAAVPVATVPNFDRNRIAIADLTGDGHLDMAISGGVIGFDAWVLLAGDGAGGFGEASISWTCSTNIETGISTADVTGDGAPEVILTSPARIVRIHESSNGSFDNMPVLYPVEGLTQRLDAGDIDLDGDLDVVTAFSSRIYRLFNSGDGTFVSTWQDAALGCMEAIALRDINGDGYPDLLMTKDPDCPPYHFYTALNNGDGTFGVITVWPIDSAGGNEFATLDWDNDGDLDVVISEMFSCPSCPSDRKWYLTNNGGGTFEPPVITTGTPGLQMVTGDFNEDGNMDFAGRASPGPWVYLGHGDGTFTHAQYASTEPPNWIDVGDMNNDGHLDLVWTSWGADQGGRTGIMLGDGSGAFTQAGLLTGPYALGHDLEVLDADGDGNLDIVVSHPPAADLVVFRGNGAGMLLPQQRYGTNGAAYQLRVGDFDGDGRKDIAVIAQTHSGANVTVLRGLGGDVPLPGDVDGDGDVDMLDLLMLLVLWGPCPPQQACPADFDGDGAVGILDLLVLLSNWG